MKIDIPKKRVSKMKTLIKFLNTVKSLKIVYIITSKYRHHGGTFLQKTSRLQLKFSKASYKLIFPLQTEFIRWVIKFPKV